MINKAVKVGRFVGADDVASECGQLELEGGPINCERLRGVICFYAGNFAAGPILDGGPYLLCASVLYLPRSMSKSMSYSVAQHNF